MARPLRIELAGGLYHIAEVIYRTLGEPKSFPQNPSVCWLSVPALLRWPFWVRGLRQVRPVPLTRSNVFSRRPSVGRYRTTDSTATMREGRISPESIRRSEPKRCCACSIESSERRRAPSCPWTFKARWSRSGMSRHISRNDAVFAASKPRRGAWQQAARNRIERWRGLMVQGTKGTSVRNFRCRVRLYGLRAEVGREPQIVIVRVLNL